MYVFSIDIANITVCTWTAPDGKTHNQIDHMLIYRRRQSSVLDVRSFRGADCDTDHYLVVVKVRERLAVSKQAVQKLDGERINQGKLKDLEVKKQYQIAITNRFAGLGNVNDLKINTYGTIILPVACKDVKLGSWH